MKITDTHTIDQYYNALLHRDSSFVGIFFACVKTTGIFCIATCRARKPKPKNVEFVTEVADALRDGYRPCKVCRPTSYNDSVPQQIQQVLDLIKLNPKEKIKDQHLREHDISPDAVRRWFKKNYGVTFHAFQRMLRINTAYQEIKEGISSSEAAYQNGYESLSGFNYMFKKVIGASPKNGDDHQPILVSRLHTPLGPMFVCGSSEGICLLEFTDRRALETEFTEIQKLLAAPIIYGENEHIKQAKKEIAEYFNGRRKQFDVKLHLPGTEFQSSVWAGLKSINYGETSSYEMQAVRLGKPTAARAVARANGCNRVAIIVPCHRVIGKDGSLTGYGGGLERKQWLLDFEQKNK